jgi:glycolate oxidase FAD binding subunit
MGQNAKFAVSGIEPARVARPVTREALAEELVQAGRSGQKVLARGEGSRMERGAPAAGLDVVIVTEGLSGVVAYEPAEMTITVQAGLGLKGLDDLLAQQGQFLPLRPYRRRGTVGGLIATGDDGALGLGFGRVRDLLIGIRAALADGSVIKGRGAVVKNVAGYDIPRLMAGSLGTLGIIVEASFRLFPRPACDGSLLAGFGTEADAFTAAEHILASQLEPVFVNVLSGQGPVQLAVGFSGSETRVRGQLDAAAGMLKDANAPGGTILSPDEDAALRLRLDDPITTLRRSAQAVVKIMSLPARLGEMASVAREAARPEGAEVRLDARPGMGVAFLSVEAPSAECEARALRRALDAAREDGSAVVISTGGELARAVDVWGPPPGDFFLMRRVKQALDPEGVFSPGRFVGGI